MTTPNKSDNLDLIKDIIKFPLRTNELFARMIDQVYKVFPIKEGSKEALGTISHFIATVGLPFPIIGWLHGYFPRLIDLIFGENGERSYLILLASLAATAHGYVKVYQRDREHEWSPYGNARFANPKDIDNADLQSTTSGIVFGKAKGKYGQEKLIVKPDTKDGHALILGGSGWGKTKSIAIPTLMRWRGSGVVVDVKGDVSFATKSFKEAQQPVFTFNPTDPQNSCVYNPLDFMKDEEDALEIARVIIPDLTGDVAYFSDTAQDILAAGLLHGNHYGLSLYDICNKIRMTPFKTLIEEFMQSDVPKVAQLASSGFEVPDNQLGAVMGELRSNVQIFATSDGIRDVTSGVSDFTPEDLENNIMVYLSIPESKMKIYGKLFGLIYAQVIKHMLDRGEGKHPPILLMMDEFAQLGKMTDFDERIATLRSRNIHIMTFIQSFSQLDKLYGVHARRIIIDNHSYEMVLGVKDMDTAKFYTGRAGNQAVEIKNKSQSTNKDGDQSNSESTSHMSTPLIRPEEWQNLPQPILFPFKCHPVKVQQTWVAMHPDPEKNFMDPLIYSAMEQELKEIRETERIPFQEPRPDQVPPQETITIREAK